MNVATATPTQIDNRLAEIYAEIAKHEAKMEQAEATLARIAEVQGTYEADYPWNSYEKQEEASAAIRVGTATIKRLHAEAAPMEERYAAERWTRFYLVTNAGGHVHYTTACATCFPTTQFAWLPDYSGMAHADLVEEAGSTACTVCFPDAPVDVLRRKTRIEEPEKKARRLERERKAAEKAAAEIRVEGYQGWSATGVKTFKSVRAVTNDIASNLSSLVWYGVAHPSAAQWLNDVKVCREALEAKGEAYDYDRAPSPPLARRSPARAAPPSFDPASPAAAHTAAGLVHEEHDGQEVPVWHRPRWRQAAAEVALHGQGLPAGGEVGHRPGGRGVPHGHH